MVERHGNFRERDGCYWRGPLLDTVEEGVIMDLVMVVVFCVRCPLW